MSEKNKEQKPKTQNVVERTEKLEQVHDALASEVMSAFTKVDKKFVEHSELLAAIIEVVGQPAVLARINERQANRDREAAEKAAAGVKLLVEKGDLKTVEAISEKTLIVGRDLDGEGKVVGPGRVQVEFALLKPEFKEKFSGSKVGAKIVTSTDEKTGITQTFEVTELYEFVEKTDEEPVAEKKSDVEPVPAGA